MVIKSDVKILACPNEPIRYLPARDLFEHDPQLNHPYEDDFSRIVCGYQYARGYAEELREFVTFWFGGVAASILPVLYAILGAVAWTLRHAGQNT
jgi:hypothetical protein